MSVHRQVGPSRSHRWGPIALSRLSHRYALDMGSAPVPGLWKEVVADESEPGPAQVPVNLRLLPIAAGPGMGAPFQTTGMGWREAPPGISDIFCSLEEAYSRSRNGSKDLKCQWHYSGGQAPLPLSCYKLFPWRYAITHNWPSTPRRSF